MIVRFGACGCGGGGAVVRIGVGSYSEKSVGSWKDDDDVSDESARIGVGSKSSPKANVSSSLYELAKDSDRRPSASKSDI